MKLSALRRIISPEFFLFLITLVVLLLTVAPSIHTSDSPELASVASTLGIAHAPGYPLYTLIAHITTYFPIGDIAFRLNLLSVLATALCAPVLYRLLSRLIPDKQVVAGTVLILLWSNSIWSIGIVAEVYAVQSLTMLIAASALFELFLTSEFRIKQVIQTGILFGIAVAIHPVNALFAGGFVFAYLVKRIPLRLAIFSGVLSITIFALSLLYFPIRYAATTDINAAGSYDAQCEYQTINLQSIDGIAWHITGRQFDSLFFADGWLPSWGQLGAGLRWFWLNFLGVGVIIGVYGCWLMWRDSRSLFWLWLILIVPYTYFFLTYGANDRFAMFNPVYLLWGMPLAYGLYQLRNPNWLRWLPFGIAFVMLIINYPLVNLRNNTEHRDRSLVTLANIPQDAVVFGHWHDIVALQYLQTIKHQRTDVKLYNLFFFDEYPQGVTTCVETYLADDTPVIFLDVSHQAFLDLDLYQFQTIFISQRYNPPLYLQLITKVLEL